MVQYLKTFPLMYQIGTIVGLTDIDEVMATSFLGVRTNRHGFGIVIWKHVSSAHKKFHLKAQNYFKLVVSRQSLYASPEGGDA